MCRVRAAQPDDLHHLIDVDIKCFDVPWSTSRWKTLYRTGTIFTGLFQEIPVGVGVMKSWRGGCSILKWGVKPQFRKQGLGSLVLHACVHHALTWGDMQRVHLIVPEPAIYPGDLNLGPFLTSIGFEATVPLIQDKFNVNGRMVPGVRFVLETSNLCEVRNEDQSQGIAARS